MTRFENSMGRKFPEEQFFKENVDNFVMLEIMRMYKKEVGNKLQEVSTI